MEKGVHRLLSERRNKMVVARRHGNDGEDLQREAKLRYPDFRKSRAISELLNFGNLKVHRLISISYVRCITFSVLRVIRPFFVYINQPTIKVYNHPWHCLD